MSITINQKLNWIEENISLDEYSMEDIRNEIKRVSFNEHNLKRYGNYSKALENMLQGLPSWNSFPYFDDDILELKKEWGYKTDDKKWLDNYWNALSNLVIQYFKKQKLELY